MVVRQAINVGLSELCAAVSAAAMASGSCPSMAVAFQPQALKRATWSSDTASEVGPSMEMWLSSNSTTSLLSLRWPAIEIDSWLMPSIRQPSPAMT